MCNSDNLTDSGIEHVTATALCDLQEIPEEGVFFGLIELEKFRHYVTICSHIPLEIYSILFMLEQKDSRLDTTIFLNATEKHSSQWPSIEKRLSCIAKSLWNYHCQMKKTVEGISEILAAMNVMKKMKTLGEHSADLFPLDRHDQNEKQTLSGYLLKLKQDAAKQEYDFTKLNKKIISYRMEMENELVPQSAILSEMLQTVPPLVKKVVIEGKTYEINIPHGTFLEERPIVSSFLHAFTMAKTKKEIESALSQANRFVIPLSDTLQFVSSGVEEVCTCIGSTVQAVASLEVFWNSIVQWLEEAKAELDQMNDSSKLLLFQSRIHLFLRSWDIASQSLERFVQLFCVKV